MAMDGMLVVRMHRLVHSWSRSRKDLRWSKFFWTSWSRTPKPGAKFLEQGWLDWNNRGRLNRCGAFAEELLRSTTHVHLTSQRKLPCGSRISPDIRSRSHSIAGAGCRRAKAKLRARHPKVAADLNNLACFCRKLIGWRRLTNCIAGIGR